MYAKNMGQLMMEKITNADMLVFNRCTRSCGTPCGSGTFDGEPSG